MLFECEGALIPLALRGNNLPEGPLIHARMDLEVIRLYAWKHALPGVKLKALQFETARISPTRHWLGCK